ncbi:hypothetical protein B4U84_22445 [Westiellopsis prolifica IICB1]|nr:hypothetical protein B4U84_22445 [Westiellopsis prolifica IICB1]
MGDWGSGIGDRDRGLRSGIEIGIGDKGDKGRGTYELSVIKLNCSLLTDSSAIPDPLSPIPDPLSPLPAPRSLPLHMFF